MRKRLYGLLLAVGTALALLMVPAWGEEPVTTDLEASAWVLMEQETGTLLGGENIHTQLEPASVTKVMTMLLVAEALDRGEIQETDLVTASEYAAGMGGSQIYLKAGEQMTVADLLKAVAVVSANDGAVALAEYLAGSETAFVERMNQRASELGMEDTHFVNCNGLPAEGHVTSAWDIALMSRELLTHSRITQYTTIWTDSLRDGAFELANTNKLLRSYTGLTGLKTGYTDTAGYCLSATAERDGMGLVAVVLGASSSADRFSLASTLLDYGFANYTVVTPEVALPPVSVHLGVQETVQPVLSESLALVLPRSQAAEITTEVILPDQAEAPVSLGESLGEIVVSVSGQEYQRFPLTAGETVERLQWGDVFAQLWKTMACAA